MLNLHIGLSAVSVLSLTCCLCVTSGAWVCGLTKAATRAMLVDGGFIDTVPEHYACGGR